MPLCRLWSVAFALVILPARADGPRVDSFGDPLPEHARARLGTSRFRGLREAAPYRGWREIDAITLSADGKTLAVADGDRLVLYDAVGGKKLRTLVTISVLGAKALAFRDRDRQLVLVGYQGVHTFDTASGKLLSHWGDSDFNNPLSVSADGKRCAVGHYSVNRPTPVVVWDLDARAKVIEVAPIQNDWVWPVLSADGTLLATGGTSRVDPGGKDEKEETFVQVWDVATGKERRRIQAHSRSVQAACFSPDGKTLATTGYDPGVRLWNLADGKERWSVEAKWLEGDVRYVRFSPDGKKVCAADTEGNVGLWEAADGKEVGRKGSKVDPPIGVGFRPDGTAVAWGTRGQVLYLWEPATGKAITPAGGHLATLHALGFSPDGKTLYSIDDEGEVLRWDAAAGKQRGAVSVREHLYYKYSRWIHGRAAFAPDGRRLIVPTYAYGLIVLDPETGTKRNVLAKDLAHSFPDWQVVFSADGSRLGAFPTPAYHYDEDTAPVPIWHTGTGKEAGVTVSFGKAPRGPFDRQVFGAFSPDGKRAVVATVIHKGRLSFSADLTGWDLTTGKKFGALSLEGAHQMSPALADDGRTVVVSGKDGELCVADLVTGRALAKVRGEWDAVTAGPVFSPDERTFAVATAGEKTAPMVRLIERGTWAERQAWPAPDGGTEALAFSPDGKTLASGHRDTTILLWDLTGHSGPRPWLKKPTAAAELWDRLKGKKADEAWRAIAELADRPDTALALLGERLKPAAEPKFDAVAVTKWIEQLDAEAFDDREAATKALRKLGRAIEPALRKALAADPPPEPRRRLDDLLAALGEPVAEEALPARGVEVLERIGTADARALLKKLAGGDPRAALTRQAKAALERLAKRR